MQFETNPIVLAERLGLASILANEKSPDPLGGSIRLSLTGNDLWVSIIRSSAYLRYSVEVVGVEDGEIGVDLAMLLADLSSMRSNIKAYTTSSNLMLESGNSKRRRPVIPVSQFQSEPHVSGSSFDVSGADLVKAISRVKYAVIKDLSRPDIKCVRFSQGKSMGANGQVFSIQETNLPFEMSLPDDMAQVVSTSFRDTDTVKITVAPWVKMETDKIDLRLALLAENYPDAAFTVYSTYRSKQSRVTMVVEKSPLEAIVSSLSIYALRGRNYGVEYTTLDFDKGYPRVVTDVPDTGRFEDDLPVKSVSGSIDYFRFSPSLFLDTLSNMSSKEVEIRLFSEMEPMVIKDPEDNTWMAIQSAMGTRATVQAAQKDEEDDF